MKVLRDEELDIAARRAVQFREEEEQQELDQKQIDISNDRIYDDEYKNAGIWAMAFFIVMFGGVLCLAYAAVSFVKYIVNLF